MVALLRILEVDEAFVRAHLLDDATLQGFAEVLSREHAAYLAQQAPERFGDDAASDSEFFMSSDGD